MRLPVKSPIERLEVQNQLWMLKSKSEIQMQLYTDGLGPGLDTEIKHLEFQIQLLKIKPSSCILKSNPSSSDAG